MRTLREVNLVRQECLSPLRSPEKHPTARKPLRAALIGFGNAGRFAHLPWYEGTTAADLAVIVEPTEAGLALAAEVTPHTPAVKSLQEACDVFAPDFVDISSPPATHAPLILESLARGMHVFCEKPPMTSEVQWAAVDRLRLRSGTLVQACHNWNFAPPVARFYHLIRTNFIGTPLELTFVADRPSAAQGAGHFSPDWRVSANNAGGIIGDLGYHGMYIASKVFGALPLEVQATSSCASDTYAEYDSNIRFLFANGCSAHLRLDWRAPQRATFLRIIGSQGEITLDGHQLHVQTPIAEWTEPVEALTADSWHVKWTACTLDLFVARLNSGHFHEGWFELTQALSMLLATYSALHLRSAARVRDLSEQRAGSNIA